MLQRGRKSAASLVAVDESRGLSPVMAPPGLSEAELGVWLATVNSKPRDYFGTEHVPMLVEYVRAVCRSSVIAQQIGAFDPEWLQNDDGLTRYQKLEQMAGRTSALIARLATCMRLTQQAIYRADKVGLAVGGGKKVWQRES